MIAMVGQGGHAGSTRQVSKESHKITAVKLLRLIEDQEYKCALTGRDLTPETATVDHVVPLAKGGTNEISNVQVLHVDVNRAKGTLTTEEFIAMCREVCSVADEKTGDISAENEIRTGGSF